MSALPYSQQRVIDRARKYRTAAFEWPRLRFVLALAGAVAFAGFGL